MKKFVSGKFYDIVYKLEIVRLVKDSKIFKFNNYLKINKNI